MVWVINDLTLNYRKHLKNGRTFCFAAFADRFTREMVSSVKINRKYQIEEPLQQSESDQTKQHQSNIKYQIEEPLQKSESDQRKQYQSNIKYQIEEPLQNQSPARENNTSRI
jgi:hypothetical protein